MIEAAIAAQVAKMAEENATAMRAMNEFATMVDAALQRIEEKFQTLDRLIERARRHDVARHYDDAKSGEIVDMPSPLQRRTRIN